MTYDFDETVVRRGTGSYKWDGSWEDDVLPMWVADMDFRTAPCIVEALRRRVEHGVFGYTRVSDAFYDAVIGWFARRHGWHIERPHIMYTGGVVPALSAVIKALTMPGDKIITQTPAYNCFFSSIRNNGCELSANRLIYNDNSYSIDFADLERRAADPRARLLLLCNPHNPSGRVWTRGELVRVAEICRRNDVVIIADEIHCEITYDEHCYTPMASIYDGDVVTCVSPSKAFNIAGLQIACIITRNADFRRRIDRAVNINEVCDVNPFGVDATIAAYNDGEEWLDALRLYLRDNGRLTRSFFAEHIPRCPVAPLEGTYLAWINVACGGLPAAGEGVGESVETLSEQVSRRLLAEQRVMVNPGAMYGPGGEHFIRLNIACPRAVLTEALSRMARFFRGI